MWASRFTLLFMIFIMFILAACGGTANSPAPTTGVTRLKVVSTVGPLVNIIYNIGGDRIELSGVIPEGSDSHTFEPAPSDAIKIAAADLIFINGLTLEEPTKKLALANKKPTADLIEFGPQTITENEYVYDFSFPREGGKPNPHLWTDPTKALRYAEIARDALRKRDSANAAYYDQNYDAFKSRIEKLDAAIKQAVASIPEKNRKLLTYHDSFPFFAPRYGFTLIGAIQPSDFGEPSAKEVADLIVQIRQFQVPAIFGSEVFPSKVLEQIGKETAARYVDTLRDDDLPGAFGDPNHSYLQMMVDDVVIMTEALGGNAEVMKMVDTTNVPGLDKNVSQPQ